MFTVPRSSESEAGGRYNSKIGTPPSLTSKAFLKDLYRVRTESGYSAMARDELITRLIVNNGSPTGD